MVEVRQATHNDTEWLLDQIKDFEAFAGYTRRFIESDDEAREIIRTLIGDHLVLIAYHAESGDHLGFVAGWKSPHPFNPRIKVLSEIFWWVPEPHRGTSAGLRLLAEFESIGRETADWVVFSLEHNSPVRQDHLIKRGFREVERAFLLEVG